MTQLENLLRRSYMTYRARLKAAERLRARQRAWNTSLLALSIATVLASIALLSDGSIYGSTGPTLLVCVSVAALVVSLAVAGLNYGARSRDMFMNYRRIQRISVEAERLVGADVIDHEQVEELARRYEAVLDDSENHTAADHKQGTPEAEVGRWGVVGSAALTAVPYAGLIVPVLVLIPIAVWAARGG